MMVLRLSFICIGVGQGNSNQGPEEFVRNEALSNFWRNYSGPRVEISLSHTNTFSRSLCDFLRIFGVCQFRIKIKFFSHWFNRQKKFTNEFSRCKNGCKQSLARAKTGETEFSAWKRREMTFQASGLFLFEFEKLGSIDKDVMAPNNVINVRYNVEAF